MYQYCKEALTYQCVFKHFPGNHHCLAIGRNKKNELMYFIFSNKWHHVGATNKHYPAYNCNLQVEEKIDNTRIPLLARMFQESGVDGVFQVKQFTWGTISVWGYSLFVFVSVGRYGSWPVCTWIGITRHPFALLVTVTWGISVTLGCRTWIYYWECWHGLASSPSKQTLCD